MRMPTGWSMNSRILTAVFAIFAVSACVAEDPGSMLIQGNQRITREQQCEPQPAQGGSQMVFLAMGVMDLLQTNHYQAHMVVASRLPTIETATGKEVEDLQIETNEITVTGAWLTYRVEGGTLGDAFFGDAGLDLDGDGELDLPGNLTLPESEFVTTSAFLANATNAVVVLELVTPAVGMALDVNTAFDHLYSAGLISVEIVLTGYLTDGTEVHSTPFTYPIKVCRGCLVAYNVNPEECCTFLDEPSYIPCFPGQDEASPCNIACNVISGSAVREEQKLRMLLGESTSLADPLPE